MLPTNEIDTLTMSVTDAVDLACAGQVAPPRTVRAAGPCLNHSQAEGLSKKAISPDVSRNRRSAILINLTFGRPFRSIERELSASRSKGQKDGEKEADDCQLFSCFRSTRIETVARAGLSV